MSARDQLSETGAPRSGRSFLRSYLEQMAEMVRSAQGLDFTYMGLEDLILKEGTDYEPARKPKGIPYRRLRYCFMNSYQLAQESRGRFTYVEGVAVNIIPTHHAWNIDKETGKVVDVTWRYRKDDHPLAYRGIELPLKLVEKILLATEVYGVLADYRNGFPLYREQFSVERALEIYDAINEKKWEARGK